MTDNKPRLRIDIVSDISCPWCVIGYSALKQALERTSDKASADIHWQPFELNPNMPSEGEDVNQHLMHKYGIGQPQIEANRANLHQRGVSVGYEFGQRGGGSIYNTFDAHRLLHWAGVEGKQTELSLALFDLYFKESGNPSDHAQLLSKAEQVGLNKQQAQQVLQSDAYSKEVREAQQHFHSQGITSVPAVIVNNKHLISGGQPVEVFEKALLQIITEA
jgi:predicted DsbA family dithiol-disulfide isomerase